VLDAQTDALGLLQVAMRLQIVLDVVQFVHNREDLRIDARHALCGRARQQQARLLTYRLVGHQRLLGQLRRERDLGRAAGVDLQRRLGHAHNHGLRSLWLAREPQPHPNAQALECHTPPSRRDWP
jgi:hypothetical protein